MCTAISLFARLKKPENESQKKTIDEISHLQIHLLFQKRKLRDLRGTGFIHLTFELSPETQPISRCPSNLIHTF